MIPLVHRTDLLIAEVVAWNVLDRESDSGEFLTKSITLYWWVHVVVLVRILLRIKQMTRKYRLKFTIDKFI